MNIQTINGIKPTPMNGWLQDTFNRGVKFVTKVVDKITPDNLTPKNVLNFIKEKGTKAAHIAMLVPMAAGRTAFRGVCNNNIAGISTLLHFIFEKDANKLYQFREIWYAFGGEEDASTVLADIRKGNSKGIPKNFSLKLIKDINKVTAANQDLVINGIKPNGLGSINGAVLANPVVGGALGAATGATITAASGGTGAPALPILTAIGTILSSAAELYKQIKGEPETDISTGAGSGSGNGGGGGGTNESSINPLMLLALGGVGLYLLKGTKGKSNPVNS